MNRFLRSTVTKAVAAILIVLLVLAGFAATSWGIREYAEYDTNFSFETEFKDSDYAAYLLELPSIYIASAASARRNGQDALAREIEQKAESLRKENNISFYIEYIPDTDESRKVYSSSAYESLEQFLSGSEHYSVIRYDGPGEITFESSCKKYQPRSYLWSFGDSEIKERFVIATTVVPSHAREVERNWTILGKLVREIFFILLGCTIGILLLYIYLVCTVGTDRNGEKASMWTDRIFSEVHLAFVALSALGYVLAAEVVFDIATINLPEYMKISLYLGLLTASTVIFLLASLSLIRQLKHGVILKNSLICRIILWAWKLAKMILRFLLRLAKLMLRGIGSFFAGFKGLLSKKSRLYGTLIFLGYTLAFAVSMIMMLESETGLLLVPIVFAAGLWLMNTKLAELDKIRKGTKDIRNGKLGTKIEGVKSADLASLSEDINSIGDGLMSSVSEKLKAEKMKSELITNVSHDLKTPLTSIINYTQLLSDMVLIPEEANDYVKILSQKSERLKALTNDLFDISKVESGNERLDIEKIDISMLLNQSLAEHESEINASGLSFITNISDELYVMADGKKMSRVIGNLISNIIKYTLENTRVFISSELKGSRAVLEFKNISSAPIDIDVTTLTQRFVRADCARSKEGNGLGLAIAKSYSEACGASFNISSDGDMFKIRIEFESV